MKIGDKLKEARLKKNMTQEEVAEKIFVSRQSISNWENNKTYPDIGNVIALSDLYEISLDELLKGSDNFMKHLEESTDLVKSNKKLIGIIILALITMIIIALFTEFLPERLNMVAIFVLSIILTGLIYSEIIKRF
ncbi:HTH-type transcriptional regulator immR [Anaerococcus prevotii]|uniref:Transcriptional regulator, XRE family n=1 Tax=Anaerococcus prevotii (strain ATCC 9321 / DSM 20548 / JCM 6508 / NCTC 11806 / PC1) TaxID=525919 RepID=C7RDF3_ANAPD|nr:helix-turn-helix domain-containing protein [Anaerococcus prevotii]ACV29216.1 transcriptional regulator, XRE family [Anaerococcus prevotii DSM 20548]SUU94891.1 HTH-type transcriptional regulator immR [Anaerococcus prevotii]